MNNIVFCFSAAFAFVPMPFVLNCLNAVRVFMKGGIIQTMTAFSGSDEKSYKNHDAKNGCAGKYFFCAGKQNGQPHLPKCTNKILTSDGETPGMREA